MSAYVSSRHFEATSKYANRNNGQEGRNVSATGSDGDRGGRGRGGGRSGQRGGRTAGRGRGGRGCGSGRMRSYINEVNVTDPNRNFSAAEWEKLGTMRGVVLRMREENGSAGRGSRSGNDSRSPTNNTNCTTSGVSATDNNSNETAEASVVSEITERGSQNGRSCGRGAYNNNN